MVAPLRVRAAWPATTDDLAPLVIVVGGDLASSPLPWDIEQASAAVAAVKLPGPPLCASRARHARRRRGSARAISAVAAAAVDRGRCAAPCRHWRRRQRARGSHAPSSCASQLGSPSGLDASTRWQAGAAVGCRSGRGVAPRRPARLPPGCNRRGSTTCRVRATTGPRPRAGERGARAALRRRPVGARTPPATGGRWANVGVRRPSAEERARQLLGPAPIEPPTDLAGWCEVAEWWGDVRRLTAAAPSDCATRRGRCGPSSTRRSSVAAGPVRDAAVERRQVAGGGPPRRPLPRPSAARRRRRTRPAGRARRPRSCPVGSPTGAPPLDVVESGSTLALVPTYTTVSRQAIFAGDLPSSFPDALWTTQPEPRRWRELWAQRGLRCHRGRVPSGERSPTA